MSSEDFFQWAGILISSLYDRPGLDLPTLLHAPSVVQQRDTVESLERELQEILQSNDRDHLQLKTILQNTEEQRTIAKNTLDILEKVRSN